MRNDPDRSFICNCNLRYVTAALAIVSIAIRGLWWCFIPSERTHQTQIGQTAHIPLPDSSTIDLNTNTIIHWRESGCRRLPRLEQGEALFNVKLASGCSFTVQTPYGNLEVLGTEFNVRIKPNRQILVTVLKGTVKASGVSKATHFPWSRTLTEKHQLEYDANGPIGDVAYAKDADSAAFWLDGYMLIRQMPLPDVVEELNRYTTKHISVDDSCLNKGVLFGIIDVAHGEATLRRLQKASQLDIVEHQDGTIGLRCYPNRSGASDAIDGAHSHNSSRPD